MRLTGDKESAFEVVLTKAAPVLAAGGALKATLSEADVRTLVLEGRALVKRTDLLMQNLERAQESVLRLGGVW